MHRLKPLAFLLLVTMGLAVQAHDEMGVTPYRPSVSTPAQLSLPGQLEFELGGMAVKNREERRDSMPYQFKLAFNSEWGVLLGGEAYVWLRGQNGEHEHGSGDTSVILKRAFIIDDVTAYGLELGAKLPTAHSIIGSGKTDWMLNTIYSRDFGTLHMDTNLNITQLGTHEPGTSRMQSGASASFSVPVNTQWSATWELSGSRRNGTDATSQFLAALSYSPSKKMTVDVGFAKGLNKASQDWTLFTGFVVPLSKLW